MIDFAIGELGVDAKDGYEDALTAGRERWRRIQLAAVVRDDPETAAQVLADLEGS